MSGQWKLGLTILATVVVCYFVLKILAFLAGFIIPLAIIGGVGAVLYVVVYKKALSGGRRTLP